LGPVTAATTPNAAFLACVYTRRNAGTCQYSLPTRYIFSSLHRHVASTRCFLSPARPRASHFVIPYCVLPAASSLLGHSHSFPTRHPSYSQQSHSFNLHIHGHLPITIRYLAISSGITRSCAPARVPARECSPREGISSFSHTLYISLLDSTTRHSISELSGGRYFYAIRM
jgi:hypothetical protein